ncbi:dihydropteroate synthase [Sulfurospirillum arcachonense]|uniref:dihydropteroate synthase n=1 Tax=Sulfurospirillum arcachonense TaxID=57666 RepID=UPI000468D4AF|nr:dihydropteroate synthase [Sulfurospirillum arcachonense]
MEFYKLDSSTCKEELFKKVGSTNMGNAILKDKANLNLIYIKDIKTPAANILKQDALSIGADLAVSRDTITCKDEFTDAILIANDAQMKILSKKELAQPFGLKKLANQLTDFLIKSNRDVKVMGILNTNEDSFYQGSRFDGDQALLHVKEMIEDGAKIIDLGGVSSRPGSIGVSDEEELSRVKPVIDAIYEEKLYQKAEFSLDSYSPLCVEYALQKGFSIINDITALENDDVARLVAKYDATVVLMHKIGDTHEMQKNPQYNNVILEVDAFFEERIQKAQSFGIKKIILDVGIGFGKTLEHNLLLIKHHAHFLHFGYELLIGASRKSMIDKICKSEVNERLPGTLAIHLKTIEEGASIVRVHDVKEHVQAIEVQKSIQEALI